jgi:hypothetical protein
VSIVDSDKKRSDEYWMGVRDALRMVDSFIKWARRNEDRAKTLDDFIHDGLIAAAKRCESCLKDDLGLSFAENQEKSTELTEPEQIPPGYEMGSTMSMPSEESFEMTPEDMSPESTEVPVESEDESVSIDAVGRLEDEEIEDLSMEGPAREFSSDFDLVEPTEFPASDSDSDTESSSTSESEVDKEPGEDSEHAPSFTWADYERAITPSEEEPEESEEEDEDVELPPPVALGTTPDRSEETTVPEPPELPPDDLKDSQSDEEETDSSESSEAPTKPPPPPPPEDEEDEEERRRRARRLFFGD